jgi:arsenate reductase (thioredoxin)
VKKSVLFLCIGNSCRSQMAEGFGRRYGSDVMECASAGLAPASIVQTMTRKVMEAKNINIDDQFPKNLEQVPLSRFDLVVNMSGRQLPTRLPIPVREWKVEDPIGQSEEVYLEVRDQIENLVMQLILELRREAKKLEKVASDRKFYSGVVRRR